ncbi:hypothetical protein OEZ85_012075 [Tetradesmus obliquus]|uniref:Protein kinase domain-containing protein n=1 Tax=Tetradesmus obliquus TaxID=3088 RepID=A0ABY8TSA1_TETOB|nr:hypothetical protein OEZ85_012075 [Tetradesmus obliquus]
MTADCHSVLTPDGPRLDADQVSAVDKQQQQLQLLQQQQQQQQQVDIAITDDHEGAGTVIHVRGPGSCSRMSDLGCVFDKLGVDIVSCSTMPTAGSCDMMLVVVDRHDSQPLDDCMKQSAPDSKPERSGGSDNTLMQRHNADADGELLVAPSPRVGSRRRRGPPPRTPSRIMLSPVAPHGDEKLFVAIPKSGSEKRRRPVMRSATVSAAATPSSAGRQSVLAALLGSQGNLGKFGPTAPSPKAAAAAAAAAGMPYNVAVAAAQLLGNSGSTRDAAAAAIAAAVANEQQQQQQYPPGTPLRSPGFASAPCSAGSSSEALRSPIAATPRGGQVPLTPPTPVHPAVAAAAAAAIAAAAEAAGEEAAAAAAAMAAAAREREALAATGVSCTIAEEVEENSSVVESVGGDADAEDSGSGADASDASDAGSSCSEEWWCGPLTGLTVRDIMTGPLQVVAADADVSVARQLMVQYNLPGILVDVGSGAEPGFLTRRDFFKVSLTRRSHKRRPAKHTVRDIMSHPVIAFDAHEPIESCAQMMQEKGVRRAAVRDTSVVPAAAAESAGESTSAESAAAPRQHLAAYVGLVSDASIFRRLGLYPEEGTALEEEDHMLLGLPLGLRQHHMRGAESSADGSGLDTPCSTSRAVPAAAAGDDSISASSSGAPDVLSRYKTAAALWEVDMSEVEVIKRIGEGSFGEVMVASYRGTKVAVKRLRALDTDDIPMAGERQHDSSTGSSAASRDGSSSPSACSRQGGSQAAFRQFFEREIAILASIRHPNVVNFIGACHKPGQRCLVTEYCARGSLDQVLHKSGLALDLLKRVEFAMDVARGMACLHAQRPIIIHRDLKTANLLVSARFEVKVADFGLSRIKDASHLQVSRAGLEGTIEYCAPEVLRGEPYTERCDVYSFGVVLHELLTRQRPYADQDVPVFLLMVNIGNGSLSLPELPAEVATPGLIELTGRCLAFHAVDRPDFREVLSLLEGEYRGLRAAQQKQPRQAAAGAQQQQQQPQCGQPAQPVLRCDSASGEDARMRKRSDVAATPSGSRYTSPFAAAASADQGDVRVVNDTNPNPAAMEPPVVSARQRGSDNGSGRVSWARKAGSDTGAPAAAAAAAAGGGKPALSPFALLQCPQGDAGETC